MKRESRENFKEPSSQKNFPYLIFLIFLFFFFFLSWYLSSTLEQWTDNEKGTLKTYACSDSRYKHARTYLHFYRISVDT